MATLVFNQAANQNGGGFVGFAVRNFFTPAGSVAGQGQFRITVQSWGAGFIIDHASVGVSVGGGDVASTTEITFSGGHGVTIAPAFTGVTSDWANFTWTAGQDIGVSIDINAGSASTDVEVTSAGTGTILACFFKSGSACWNTPVISGSGFSSQGSFEALISAEMQSSGTQPTSSIQGGGGPAIILGTRMIGA
jgi:hypothetical protein